jgi:hypothetical protein
VEFPPDKNPLDFDNHIIECVPDMERVRSIEAVG